MKNCFLEVLGRLRNPSGFTYIFAWNTKIKKYVVKRERNGVTENSHHGGGEENRRVMRDFDDLASFYNWGLSKDWVVLDALPLFHSL